MFSYRRIIGTQAYMLGGGECSLGIRGQATSCFVPFDVLVAGGIVLFAKTPRGGVHANSEGEPPPQTCAAERGRRRVVGAARVVSTWRT